MKILMQRNWQIEEYDHGIEIKYDLKANEKTDLPYHIAAPLIMAGYATEVAND